MHRVELYIPADYPPPTTSPAHSGKPPERGVQHLIYQAMLQVTRDFFEQSGLIVQGEARLPHLMLELTCLRTEALFGTQAMRLEARLNIASEEGFSIDYSFWGTQGKSEHELAAWRSLHSFYDYEAEEAFIVDSHFSYKAMAAVGSQYWPTIAQKAQRSPIQATTQSYR